MSLFLFFKFSVTYYRDEYERNNARLQSSKGRVMKVKRQSTVEPIFGTLTQFMGLRKITTSFYSLQYESLFLS